LKTAKLMRCYIWWVWKGRW